MLAAILKIVYILDHATMYSKFSIWAHARGWRRALIEYRWQFRVSYFLAFVADSNVASTHSSPLARSWVLLLSTEWFQEVG